MVAGCARLVDFPKPLLGHADSGWTSTTRRFRESTSTAASGRSSNVISGCGQTICTVLIDELVRPNPDTRPVIGRCGVSRSLRPLVRLGLHAVPARCTIRSRARTGSWGGRREADASEAEEARFPGDFIVEYVARPEAGLRILQCWPRPCSTSLAFGHASSHGIVLGNDGQKIGESLRNYRMSPAPRSSAVTGQTRCAGF